MQLNFSKIKLIIIILFFSTTGLLVYSFTSNKSSSVKTPHELLEQNSDLPRIRVGGKVSNDKIDYQTSPAFVLKFQLEDREKPGQKMQVVYQGIKPDMFSEGRDVLIDGELKNGVIVASSLLTQCPSKYEPKVAN